MKKLAVSSLLKFAFDVMKKNVVVGIPILLCLPLSDKGFQMKTRMFVKLR